MSPYASRRKVRRDGPEAEIVNAVRQAGAVVYRLDRPYDLLVGYRGTWRVWEVKDPTGRLTPAQEEERKRLEAAGLEVTVVRSVLGAMVALGVAQE